jgi:hypothetical protein
MSREADEWTIQRDGLALKFVTPSCIVAQTFDHQRQIHIEGFAEWLAVVSSLERGQLLTVAFHQVSQAVTDTKRDRLVIFQSMSGSFINDK